MKFTVEEEISAPPPKIYHLELNEHELKFLRAAAGYYGGMRGAKFLEIVGNDTSDYDPAKAFV